MAKQTENFITGTIGDLTYYLMDGIYYARLKSSLSGKRVRTDPKFKRTMENAGRLARASRLAAHVYMQTLPAERKFVIYRLLTGMAIRALRDEMPEADITALLQDCRDFLMERMEAVKLVKEVKLSKGGKGVKDVKLVKGGAGVRAKRARFMDRKLFRPVPVKTAPLISVGCAFNEPLDRLLYAGDKHLGPRS